MNIKSGLNGPFQGDDTEDLFKEDLGQTMRDLGSTRKSRERVPVSLNIDP